MQLFFAMFNTDSINQPKSTPKKLVVYFKLSIEKSGDMMERTLGNSLSSVPLT